MPSGTVRTRRTIIPPAAAARPGWVFLGESPTQADAGFSVLVQADAAAGTLDVDTFLVISLDDGSTQVIAVEGAAAANASVSASEVVANHNALTAPVPTFDVTASGLPSAWPARGALAIYTQASTIEAILLATGSSAAANTWRQVASSAVIDNAWVASRLPARLTPE
jgi:hypothetical protein